MSQISSVFAFRQLCHLMKLARIASELFSIPTILLLNHQLNLIFIKCKNSLPDRRNTQVNKDIDHRLGHTWLHFCSYSFGCNTSRRNRLGMLKKNDSVLRVEIKSGFKSVIKTFQIKEHFLFFHSIWTILYDSRFAILPHITRIRN